MQNRNKSKPSVPRRGEIVLMVVDNKGSPGGGKQRSSREPSGRMYNNGERIVMTSYLQMRTGNKTQQKGTGSTVGGYYPWNDGKGGAEPSQHNSPSSRTKMSSSRSFKRLGTQPFAQSDYKLSAQENGHEDSWLNQTVNTQDLMIKRSSASRSQKSRKSKYQEKSLITMTPRKPRKKQSKSKSRSSKKHTTGTYIYGTTDLDLTDIDHRTMPKRKKSSNKSLYVAPNKLIRVRGSRSQSRSQSKGTLRPNIISKQPVLEKEKYGPPQVTDVTDTTKPLNKSQERQRRLDEYYRKKLKYLEEKSEILEEVRRRQEQEDLRIMGTSIPTISERSRLLANLHNQKKQLISDEKFLKRYFDHEKNSFQTKINKDYVYSPQPSKRPLPREWVFNDFEAAEAQLPRHQKENSPLLKQTPRKLKTNEYGEYQPDRHYKLSP